MLIGLECENCENRLLAADFDAGRQIPCPHCGRKVRVPGLPAGAITSSEPEAQEPRHSVFGVVSTILGGMGSLLLLLRFGAPGGDGAEALTKLALTINTVGFCIALGSFFQPDRLRAFSWAGIILSIWPLALLALVMSVMSRSSSGRWLGGSWGTAFCPHCSYSWYPRGHFAPAKCPRCRAALQ